MMNKELPISVEDYKNIFRVLHAVAKAAGNTPGKACIFYNVIGSFLLKEKFSKEAYPQMGAAFFRVNDKTDTVIAYCKEDGNCFTSDEDGFHCLVLCDNHYIDFTSPVYRESFLKNSSSASIPRKMFQKPLTKMANSNLELFNEGDFYFEGNRNLTEKMISNFMYSDVLKELILICFQWFNKSPINISSSFLMYNDLGEEINMKLDDILLTGAW